ncbi:MAG: hypothetical protein Ct9H300mP18_14680 [Candidatus Neomarinimicrobiota bacterium]|nr:MAG: hypothetical protein Ct9H300mP18_14680 [Candidatus Neomarinimicrobiota bacterium]
MNEFDIGLDILGLVVTISAFMFGFGAIPSGLGGEQTWWKNIITTIFIWVSRFSAFLVSISNSFYF